MSEWLTEHCWAAGNRRASALTLGCQEAEGSGQTRARASVSLSHLSSPGQLYFLQLFCVSLQTRNLGVELSSSLRTGYAERCGFHLNPAHQLPAVVPGLLTPDSQHRWEGGAVFLHPVQPQDPSPTSTPNPFPTQLEDVLLSIESISPAWFPPSC